MNQKETLGWTLFTLGFLVAAATAMRIPPVWEAFVPAIIIACGGALIARQGAMGGDSSDHSDEVALDEKYLPTSLATVMIKELSRIDAHTGDDKAKEIIESLQNNEITHFVEQRRIYLREYGATSFANFFGSFAKAERNVNRAWSALVDEHREEMLASVELAKSALDEVVHFFKKV